MSMKNAALLALVLTLAVAGCGRKPSEPALVQGTAAWELAQEFAKVMPALGPDKVTVVARAKDFVITAAEVIQAIRDNLGTRTDQFKGLDAGQLKGLIEQGARQLAERKVLLAAATKARTTISPEDLESAMKAQYDRAGGEQAFLDLLKSADIGIDHVKSSIRESLLINKYLAGVVEAGLKVPEEDLRRAYDEVAGTDKTATVRHILLLTQGKSEAEKAAARKKIEGLLARAKAGEDFAELAKRYSEDPGSKDNGGLYEDFPRGQMVKPFEDAAFSVPIGELSGIVETDFGYHILKVIDRKKETRTFEELRGELEAKLRQEKQTSFIEDHIRDLKEKAKLELIAL